MAPNSIEVMWGPGLIGEHSGDSPYLAADIGQGFIIATVYGFASLSLYPILTCKIPKVLWDILWAVYILPAIFSTRFEKTQVIREHTSYINQSIDDAIFHH